MQVPLERGNWLQLESPGIIIIPREGVGGALGATARNPSLPIPICKSPIGGALSTTSPNLKANFRTQEWSCDSREVPVWELCVNYDYAN